MAFFLYIVYEIFVDLSAATAKESDAVSGERVAVEVGEVERGGRR